MDFLKSGRWTQFVVPSLLRHHWFRINQTRPVCWLLYKLKVKKMCQSCGLLTLTRCFPHHGQTRLVYLLYGLLCKWKPLMAWFQTLFHHSSFSHCGFSPINLTRLVYGLIRLLVLYKWNAWWILTIIRIVRAPTSWLRNCTPPYSFLSLMIKPD